MPRSTSPVQVRVSSPERLETPRVRVSCSPPRPTPSVVVYRGPGHVTPCPGVVTPMFCPPRRQTSKSTLSDVEPRSAAPSSETAPPSSEPPEESIDELLEDRTKLKKAVVQCFRKVADSDLDSLDLQGLKQFRLVFSQAHQVPDQALGDLLTEYLCFDFDGSGQLDVNEVYKLVKFHLYAHRKKGLGEVAQIPFKTLEAAGFKVVRELGKGSQATAKLATKGGKECCVKCMHKRQLSHQGVLDLMEEYEAMQLVACDKVAQVSELFQDQSHFYMVGDVYLGGDFVSLKKRAQLQGVSITSSWWKGIFHQCFEGMKFMHAQAIVHCDLKEPNMMIKAADLRRPEVVIIDFGVCIAMAGQPGGFPKGTPGYIPPETLDSGKWYPRGDVFSMGVTIIQLILDKVPPVGTRTSSTPGGIFVEGCQTVQDICRATRTRVPPFHQVPRSMHGLGRLLRELLSKDMSSRPTTFQVLKDPWFDNAEREIRGKHARATAGITKSFMANMDNSEMQPAAAALLKLQQKLGVAKRKP